MKVLNLRCAAGHGFEGWFGSEADYQSQAERGLLSCPVCGDSMVQRLPSAPRLNLSGAQAPGGREAPRPGAGATTSSSSPAGAAAARRAGELAPIEPRLPVAQEGGEQHQQQQQQRAALELLWLQTVKQVLATTEDVGGRFAEEARRIHYGETEHRNIRGQTSPQEARELAEEGVEVFSLPIPDSLKGPLN